MNIVAFSTIPTLFKTERILQKYQLALLWEGFQKHMANPFFPPKQSNGSVVSKMHGDHSRSRYTLGYITHVRSIHIS